MSVANQNDVLTVTVNGPCDCSILLREYDSTNVATGRTLNTVGGMAQIEPGKYRLSSAFFTLSAGTFTWKIDLAGSAACAAGLATANTDFVITVRPGATGVCAVCTVAGIAAAAVTTDIILDEGEPFQFVVPLTGSQPFSFCAKSLPDGVTAEIVGNLIVVNGKAKKGRIALAVQNACSCECATFTRVIGQSAAQVNCPVKVDITNDTIDIIGVQRTWNITSSVPACTEVSVSIVGTRNGTPYSEVFNANLPFTRVDAASALGSTESLTVTVLAACGIVCPATTKLLTNVASGCDILLEATNPLITTVGVFRSYVITSPSGKCTKAEIVATGTINGAPFATQSIQTLPYNFIDPTASLAGDNANIRLDILGVGACVGAKICGSGTRLITNVPNICQIALSLSQNRFIENVAASQTYTAINLPVGAIVVWDLYEANVVVPGASFSLSYASPSLTIPGLTFPSGTAGKDYNWRPRLPLTGTATSCTVITPRVDFDVFQTATQCAVTWSVGQIQFTEGVPSPAQVYTSSGIPPGGAITFRLYKGALLQGFGEFTLTSAVPSLNVGSLTFPIGTAANDYEYRPDSPAGTAIGCNVAPSAIGFTVTAAAVNPPAACGAVLNASCGGSVISVNYSNAAACSGKRITVVPSTGTVSPSAHTLTGAASGNVVFSIANATAATTYQVFFDAVAVGTTISNCVAGAVVNPCAASANLCDNATTEFAVAPTNVQSPAGQVIPVIIDTVQLIATLAVTRFTNATPTYGTFVARITITAAATTVGAPQPLALDIVPGIGAAAGAVRWAVSRSPCGLNTDECGRAGAGGTCVNSDSILCSVNDPGLFNGTADFNLTTGTWYVTLQVCGLAAYVASANYNINKLLQISYLK